MDIEEINKLIEEIERDNREYYWKLRERKREKKLQERVKKIKKKKNIILTISVPSLLIALLYIKQYINYNFNNIYKENTIKISSEKIKNIKEEIEKTFRIRIDEETTNKYLLLNALLENSSLSYQEKKYLVKKF